VDFPPPFRGKFTAAIHYNLVLNFRKKSATPTPAQRLMSTPSTSASASTIEDSSRIQPKSIKSTGKLPLRPLSGPSGRPRVGLSVSMSEKMVQERDEEWRKTVDLPLYTLVKFFDGTCIVCYLDGSPEHMYHTSSDCSKGYLRKKSDDYYAFRKKFNVPDKMCFGCGLHVGVRPFNYFIQTNLS
jgi:hypothetical protein